MPGPKMSGAKFSVTSGNNCKESSLSRIGKLPVSIPQGVKIEQQGNTLVVTGPKGTLSQEIHPEMRLKVEDAQIVVERPSEGKQHRSLHGLTRSLVQNLVTGANEGFVRKLAIVGVGYRAEVKGKGVALYLGYSHPIYFSPPEGIKIETPTQTNIVVSGIDKQLVGEVAAKIRSFRPPEPYKGKGVRYEEEHVRRKAGKATA